MGALGELDWGATREKHPTEGENAPGVKLDVRAGEKERI